VEGRSDAVEGLDPEMLEELVTRFEWALLVNVYLHSPYREVYPAIIVFA